jgi:hypothetical protein
MMPILSNYQEGTRNAKVYKTTNGEYGVIVYDAQDDFNGFESFVNEDLAEEFAEDWVLRAGR